MYSVYTIKNEVEMVRTCKEERCRYPSKKSAKS